MYLDFPPRGFAEVDAVEIPCFHPREMIWGGNSGGFCGTQRKSLVQTVLRFPTQTVWIAACQALIGNIKVLCFSHRAAAVQPEVDCWCQRGVFHSPLFSLRLRFSTSVQWASAVTSSLTCADLCNNADSGWAMRSHVSVHNAHFKESGLVTHVEEMMGGTREREVREMKRERGTLIHWSGQHLW